MKYKKLIVPATLSIALLASNTAYALSFKDVKATDWFNHDVYALVEKGGITGYPDGSFKPAGTITKAEYLSMTLKSLGYQPNIVSGSNVHWSAGVYQKAKEINLIKNGEIDTNVNSPITRYEAALVACRALSIQKEEPGSDYMEYGPWLKDYNSVPGTYKNYVSQAYSMGIITGYQDKSFGGNRTLTRAEASTIVLRIIDKNVRVATQKPSTTGKINVGETKPIEQVITKGLDDLNVSSFGYKYTKVTLLPQDPYGLYYSTGGSYQFLTAPNETAGGLLYLKDGAVFGIARGQYGTKGLVFSVGKQDDYKVADYLAIVMPYDDVVKLFPNPFKEN